MIELNTTWNTIVMLLVAGGVGLIGGVGAALIELKARAAAAPTTGTGSTGQKATDPSSDFLNILACVVLGGIAAVAVLYFFPPTKEVVPEGGGATETSYDLIKLVALSLIVGSAGTVFLQSLQARALNLANEQKVGTVTATAGAAVDTATKSMPGLAATRIEASTSEATAAIQQKSGLSAEQSHEVAKAVLGAVADTVSEGLAEDVQKQADDAQRVVAAAASGEAVVPSREPLSPPVEEGG
jgi:uncharacterized protein (DUF2267 family)